MMSISPSLDQFCYSPAQTALVLGRSRQTVYRLMSAGHLKVQHTPVGPIITREELLRFLTAYGEHKGKPRAQQRKDALDA